jgi:hypothetical protein
MPLRHRAAAGLLVALAAVGGGCRPVQPTYPDRSDFYVDQDLGAMLQQAAAAGGFTVETMTASGAIAGPFGPGRIAMQNEQTWSVQCRPEDRGKVLPALKAQFQKRAQEKAAVIEDSGESENLTSFTLRYTAGGGHGTVKAALGEGKPVPGKPGVVSYPVSVHMEESVP